MGEEEYGQKRTNSEAGRGIERQEVTAVGFQRQEVTGGSPLLQAAWVRADRGGGEESAAMKWKQNVSRGSFCLEV